MATVQQEVEADAMKLFIGGISWDTNEDHLMKYFKKFGEVEEAIVMRDWATGRSRGFGFIMFADSTVAKHVIMEKHIIDGWMVEAKKAIPRDDMSVNNSHGSAHGSRGSRNTKKIFVGGLASTMTKADFTKYFEQFGTIIDVVMVYDHQTQRHKGFGFITYDSEDAMDRALFKTFHKLKGKRIDVKRAIPKEPSPRPSMCSPISGFNYVTGGANSFLNGYTQHYNMSPLGGYGMRMDECFGLLASGNNGYPSFSGNYGIEMNFDPWMNPCTESGFSFNSGIQHEGHIIPYYNGNSDEFNNYFGYGGVNENNGSAFDSLLHNFWGIFGPNHSSSSRSSNFFVPFENGDLSGIGNNNVNCGNLPHVPALGANNCSIYCTGNFCYGSSEINFGESSEINIGPGSNVYGRNVGSSGVNILNQSTNGYARNFGDSSSVGGGSIYGETTQRSGPLKHDGTNPLARL